ncbi:hypothetical protein J1N35_044015 [Gossypium stocksii]|uniref:RNase H type-1 domain-containing protein n=1 Tax=Gossypium stocksii TaxID=47602 RepID=A0A9D3U859_9ROSI|nr:hypothetical protein J1N35_044015 [Gossypium stocksii]
MGACTHQWQNVRESTTAEAWACLQAVTFAEELGFQDICVEGDTLTVVKKLNDEHMTANGAAHRISFYGQQYDSPTYWVEEVPTEIEHLILKDMQGFREG